MVEGVELNLGNHRDTPCQNGRKQSTTEAWSVSELSPRQESALPCSFFPSTPRGHASCNRPLDPRGARGPRTRMGPFNAVPGDGERGATGRV